MSAIIQRLKSIIQLQQQYKSLTDEGFKYAQTAINFKISALWLDRPVDDCPDEVHHLFCDESNNGALLNRDQLIAKQCELFEQMMNKCGKIREILIQMESTLRKMKATLLDIEERYGRLDVVPHTQVNIKRVISWQRDAILYYYQDYEEKCATYQAIARLPYDLLSPHLISVDVQQMKLLPITSRESSIISLSLWKQSPRISQFKSEGCSLQDVVKTGCDNE